MVSLDSDRTRSVCWKPIGPKQPNGFQPTVKRTYRLRHAPAVLGELAFSHFIQRGSVALYLFEPMFAHEGHMQQLVELRHVEERE